MEGIYSKIVNPSTGRKVNINSKLGKQIIYNYINNQNGGTSTSDQSNDNEYKNKMKYHKETVDMIANNVNKEYENINKDRTSKLDEIEQDKRDLDIRRRQIENYKSAAKQYHENQNNFHKSVKKQGMKCYRSKKKGTCELEPFFLGIDDNVDDEDTSSNKCIYDTDNFNCYADFSKWSNEDYTKLHDTLYTLDYDEQNNLFWREVEDKQVPFTTSQRVSDFVGKGHGTLSYF